MTDYPAHVARSFERLDGVYRNVHGCDVSFEGNRVTFRKDKLFLTATFHIGAPLLLVDEWIPVYKTIVDFFSPEAAANRWAFHPGRKNAHFRFGIPEKYPAFGEVVTTPPVEFDTVWEGRDLSFSTENLWVSVTEHIGDRNTRAKTQLFAKLEAKLHAKGLEDEDLMNASTRFASVCRAALHATSLLVEQEL